MMEIPFIVESFDAYISRSRGVDGCVGSHALAEFRRCPRTYYLKKCGRIAQPDSSAFAFGSAAHKLILEGRTEFENEFVVSNGPKNERTGKPYGTNTKAFRKWRSEQTKTVISASDHASICRMADSILSHKIAGKLIYSDDAIYEGVLRNELEFGGAKIHMQSRLDCYSPEFGIVDLKTCADLDAFNRDISRFGYANQIAFYQTMVHQFTGNLMELPTRIPHAIVAAEKREPFRCGVWRISPDALFEAHAENRTALHELATCTREENWPTRYEGVQIFRSKKEMK